ncbi:MAG: DEAD/DEAH box helicase family protein [Bacillota bacterium]
MKLQFKEQAFQTRAVESVCDLFHGQEKTQSTFSIDYDRQISMAAVKYGVGNNILLNESTIIENMKTVQRQNHLLLTNDLKNKNFSVEMETGTGKTFVYTKTIFEMNKRYGFTKFVIVVPSVAIREGVYKSLSMTEEYFSLHYNSVPNRYFIYNSAKLSDVRLFAMSDNIEIMIMNIDAFKKSENIINQDNDKMGGVAAMRYIQDTNPIVIIDEPQSVDNTNKAKEAIASLNPSCVLRYSATHKDKVNVLYRLTPVDAFQQGLVKQIVVSSNRVEDDYNKPYIKLLSVSHDNGFKARIEIDIKKKDLSIQRKEMTVKSHDDLFLLSNKRDIYEGYQVAGIDCTPDKELVEFVNTEIVKLGKAVGDVPEMELKKAQIRRTIETHLDKELLFMERGIKVLSLFFLDKVENYRDAEGGQGIYAKYFEECYESLIVKEKYAPLKNKFTSNISAIHNGYFSQDKKGKLKDTKGDTAADYDTYNTIMKDKEWLLSFDCPLRFIWSHSALKEGWDNPNVFQVCTLIEQKSVFTCRQKIGRGLRLCVNQEGERIEDTDVNLLHVMANESFVEFAENLQHEYEADTGFVFGVVQSHLFVGMVYEEKIMEEKVATKEVVAEAVTFMKQAELLDETGTPTELAKQKIIENELNLPPKFEMMREELVKAAVEKEVVKEDTIVGKTYVEEKVIQKEMTEQDSEELMEHFQEKKYISSNGKMKDTMKEALANGTLNLPEKFENARQRLEGVLHTINQKPMVRDAKKEVKVTLNKQVFVSPEFRELWDKIKQKTAYRVQIDTEQLVKNCIRDIAKLDPITETRIVTQSANMSVETTGVTHREFRTQTIDLDNEYLILPNIIMIISEATLLTRATVRRILLECNRSTEFMVNPQKFLQEVLNIVQYHRHNMAIDGISYIKLQDETYYAQEIFACEELFANLDRNAVAVQKSVFDYVVYDSATVEKPFAVALSEDPDVKLFFKIPDKFRIETPIGNYNPDWAVYLTKDNAEKLYFVVETKGSVLKEQLRESEAMKIHCGIKHFEVLEENVDLKLAKQWASVKERV